MMYHRELEVKDLPKLVGLQLRQADQDEVRVALQMEPNVALIMSVAVSDWVRVILIQDEIVGVFGLLGNVPWFMASDRIYEYKLTFLRQSKHIFQQMLKEAGRLHNMVDSRHIEAIQWLEWLGCEIDMVNPIFLNGVKFYLFSKRG